MRQEGYAYSVASVRQLENGLLGAEMLNKLSQQTDYKSVVKMLKEIKYIKSDKNIEAQLQRAQKERFEHLKSVAPHPKMLDFLIVENDYHNIKVMLKSLIREIEPDRYFLTPSIIEPMRLKKEAFGERDLPDFARYAIEKVYPILTKTLDGQYVDIMLDNMSMESAINMAKETKSEQCIDWVETIVATANIKIVVRGLRANINSDILNEAVVANSKLDVYKLVGEALKGKEQLYAYLKNTQLKQAVEMLKISDVAFEKWCDDIIIEKIRQAKLISFGIEPLVAYYYATLNEIKNLKVILSLKRAGEKI